MRWILIGMVAALVVAGVWLVLRARAARTAARRRLGLEIRAGFRRFVAEHHPALSARYPELAPAPSEAEAAGAAGAIIGRVEAAAAAQPAAREAIFAAFAAALAQGFSPFAGALSLKLHGQSVLPRLVPADLLGALPGAAATPVQGTGAAAVYVVEAAEELAYLTAAHLEALGIDTEAVHGLALANLRQRFGGEAVRAAVAGGAPRTLPRTDAFTASRLLLVPEHLEAGEVLAAAAPDPDTLILAALERAEELAAAVPGAAAALLARPLRITRLAIEEV